MIEAVKDLLQGKPLVRRSSQWPAVRNKHLQQHPACEVCGTKKKLDVHHIFPVHDCPEGELYAPNLITLCRVHHFLFGHLGAWKSHNPLVEQDASIWRVKILNRPK